jgi:hypothetical protein
MILFSWNAAVKISSLLKKPANGGIPAMAKQAIKKAICVI